MNYVLPDYLLHDAVAITETMRGLNFDTRYLILDLDKIDLYWDGEKDEPAGYVWKNPDTRRYEVVINERTLKGLNEGHGISNG